MSKPIPQDTERFAKLAPDKRTPLPPGHTAPLDFKPTRTLIRERQEALWEMQEAEGSR